MADDGVRRAAHWVLKVGDLKRTMDFFERVLSLRVLRHEEFAATPSSIGFPQAADISDGHIFWAELLGTFFVVTAFLQATGIAICYGQLIQSAEVGWIFAHLLLASFQIVVLGSFLFDMAIVMHWHHAVGDITTLGENRIFDKFVNGT